MEAIRAQIKNGSEKRSLIDLKETPIEIKEKIMQKLLNCPTPINLLPTSKSVTQLVSDSRERL